MSAQANMAGMFPPTKAMRWFSLPSLSLDLNWIRWLDSFPWQPVPVHTLPLNQDRWGKGDQLLWQRWWRLCSFFQQKIIHSVLGEKADCPRAEQLLNEVGTIINFSRKSQWVFYFTSLMYLIIHQAKCFFKCKLISWQYLQRAGSRGKGDEKNPWISLGAAWLHLQTLGKADDKCHGGDFTHFKQNSSAM